MIYISTKEYAKAHGLAERTVRNYCVQGKITGAQLIGKSWNIPADAPLPDRKNASLHLSPLLKVLKEQRDCIHQEGTGLDVLSRELPAHSCQPSDGLDSSLHPAME